MPARPHGTFAWNEIATTDVERAMSFYTGTIARRIAEDMAANGGVIGLDDLGQYRAMERKPLQARYRDHLVYSAPPPVSTTSASPSQRPIECPIHPGG